MCLSVCGHSNVPTLTSPPILKLWDTKGYLWLPYDITEVIKLFKETFGPKKFFLSARLASVSTSRDLNFPCALSQNLDKLQFLSNIKLICT